MRVADHVLAELVEIVEWPENSTGIMAWRYPLNGEIKYGAKLSVKDHQEVIVMAEGEFADLYNPGLYTLVRENMPRLSVIKRWDESYRDPFKADFFFIKTKYFIDLPWSISSDENGKVRYCGKFDIKIINARKIIQKLMTSSPEYATADAIATVEKQMMALLPDAIRQGRITTREELEENLDIAAFIQESINIEFNNYGLLMRNLTLNIAEG